MHAVIATILSIVGFLVLRATVTDPMNKPIEFAVIYVAGLALLGLCVMSMIQRVRALTDYYQNYLVGHRVNDCLNRLEPTQKLLAPLRQPASPMDCIGRFVLSLEQRPPRISCVGLVRFVDNRFDYYRRDEIDWRSTWLSHYKHLAEVALFMRVYE